MKNIHLKLYPRIFIATSKLRKPLFMLIIIGLLTASCDDFVDVELPKDRLPSEAVFEDVSTATAALRHIYAGMRGGLVSKLSLNMGLYADELDNVNNQDAFYDHTVSVHNGTVMGWWSNTYNLIYAANAVIEGVENSVPISLDDQNQLKGEALFIRAYLHSLLVETFGPIPYIRTTNYVVNTNVSRIPVVEVYNYIINDLTEASNLLGDDISGERIRAYKGAVYALLARVYLYAQDFEAAEDMADKAINTFVLEPELNKVFLKNASGSIWQIKPFQEGDNTEDANLFIFTVRPTIIALSTNVVNAFEPGDQRVSNWIGSTIDGMDIWYYAFKYKEAANTSSSLEYPIMLRLAEQYLIRAEARVNRDDIDIEGAQSDLNVIRTRAGLPNITAASKEELLKAILHERHVELFTEQGHRWFDLKRTRKAAEVLAPIKPGWQDRDILFPVPESEILLNPNLLPQNDGYN